MTIAEPAAMRLPTPDSDLRRLLAAVKAACPDAEVYLVGGGVRDLLRGAQPADLDFVMTGDVASSAQRLAASLGGHAFALDAERAQHRIVLDASAPSIIDLSPLAGDIEADLARRDFTVDAMAAAIETNGDLGPLLDPHGGQRDLETAALRMVSEAAFEADPLRLLRAVRLSVELDFSIEPATAAAIRRRAASVNDAAAERLQAELTRILTTDRSAAGVRLLDELGLLAALLPELTAARGVDQPGDAHYWDVFDHSIQTLASLDLLLSPTEPLASDQSWRRHGLRETLAWFPLDTYLDEPVGGQPRRVLLKLAGLLHDIAKPQTKTVQADGRGRFFGHSELGAEQATAICQRLRFGNRETRFVALLIEEHLRPTQLAARGQAPSPRALARFRRDLGDALPALLLLTLADGAAAAGPRLQPERWQRQVAYMSYVLQQSQAQAAAVAQTSRLVSGNDLMAALGLEPGPQLGRVLDAVNEAIEAGELTTREQALAYAQKLRQEGEVMSDASLISAVVIAIVAYVYLTIIRPAHKDQMRHRQEMRDLRPGDQVITTANILATVKDIQVQASGPTRIWLEIADGVVVIALPGAILEHVPAPTDASQPSRPGMDAST